MMDKWAYVCDKWNCFLRVIMWPYVSHLTTVLLFRPPPSTITKMDKMYLTDCWKEELWSPSPGAFLRNVIWFMWFLPFCHLLSYILIIPITIGEFWQNNTVFENLWKKSHFCKVASKASYFLNVNKQLTILAKCKQTADIHTYM